MFKVRNMAGLPNNLYSNIRYYSNIKLYDDYKNITSDILNKLVVNQDVSITQHILDKLITIPSVKFYLPITDQTIPGLVGLIGTPKTRGLKAGVYIFTHKATGRKYVGSSNSLSIRLDQYFNFKHFNQHGCFWFPPPPLFFIFI
uniref:GIY-YIG endonuclease n=1 Tax=Monilinia laxa TaxID=61186 RepID=A0A8F8ST28_MONLA|nr:GIY-YIG endonuclease [Monilinia laxa]QYB20043.1 LAGLIDADG endonuclease [Monilinia laxa]QYB20139.1 GIY-YIG endonuclease [Monilinia laxa]QYB20205.1 GIY-YIG endonuclease [Monilinia laxa]QYB20290.1 GIY-YIG endonuclease [Monilinia laxa]